MKPSTDACEASESPGRAGQAGHMIIAIFRLCHGACLPGVRNGFYLKGSITRQFRIFRKEEAPLIILKVFGFADGVLPVNRDSTRAKRASES